MNLNLCVSMCLYKFTFPCVHKYVLGFNSKHARLEQDTINPPKHVAKKTFTNGAVCLSLLPSLSLIICKCYIPFILLFLLLLFWCPFDFPPSGVVLVQADASLCPLALLAHSFTFSCPLIIQLYITFHPASLCAERKTKLNKILFLPDISRSLSLTLSPRLAFPLLISVNSDPLFIVLLSDSDFFNNLMGEGFCVWCHGIMFISQSLKYLLMECSGKSRFTLPHTGCSALSVEKTTNGLKERERER